MDSGVGVCEARFGIYQTSYFFFAEKPMISTVILKAKESSLFLY